MNSIFFVILWERMCYRIGSREIPKKFRFSVLCGLNTSHPDPFGRKMSVLLDAFARLQSGETKRVEMDALNSLFLGNNVVTKSATWKKLLDTTYIWYVGEYHSITHPYLYH